MKLQDILNLARKEWEERKNASQSTLPETLSRAKSEAKQKTPPAKPHMDLDLLMGQNKDARSDDSTKQS